MICFAENHCPRSNKLVNTTPKGVRSLRSHLSLVAG